MFRRRINIAKTIDLTGQKYGRLTVVKINDDDIRRFTLTSKSTYWWCKCDCGNVVSILSSSLRSGLTKSCGCLRNDSIYKLRKKYNKYDLTGEYGIGITSNTSNKFYFDLEDYEKIKDYCWYEDKKNGYLCTRESIYENVNKPMLLFHRIVMQVTNPDLDVDHIRHIKLDNRKSELRIGTHQKNTINLSKRSDNTSGIVGVSYRKDRDKWRAEINYENKYIYLGMFDNFEDAVEIRKDAEEKYFGKWSYNNSMKNKKGE